MEYTRLTLLTGLMMGIVSCGPTPADPKKEHRLSKTWVKGSYEAKLLGDDLQPFDPDELVALAKHPKSDSEGRLGGIILRAGAEKDTRLRLLGEWQSEGPQKDTGQAYEGDKWPQLGFRNGQGAGLHG